MFLLKRARPKVITACLIVGVFLLPGFAPFIDTVEAAGPAKWIDQATIEHDGKQFKDTDTSDADWYFKIKDLGNGCSAEIKDFKNPGYNTLKGPYKTQTVKLYKQKVVAGGCQADGTQDIVLPSSPNGYDVAFVWIDDSNIHSADGKKKFSKDDKGVFISTTDGTACKDFLTIGANKANPTLTVRSDKGFDVPNDSLRAKYAQGINSKTAFSASSGYSFAKDIQSNGDVKLNGKDCHESKTITVAASTANAAKTGTSTINNSGTGTTGEDNSCESKGKLAWILCPVIEILDGIFNWLDTQIQALLEVNENAYKDKDLYTAWAQIRNIAYIILIPMMLVMVVATALGAEIFSAYTVKKAIPRMVAAVIFIALSWYICGFLIGFFNAMGTGVLGLITSPFNLDGQITLGSLFDPSFAQGAAVPAVGGALAVGAFAAVAVEGLLGILILYFAGAVLAIFIAFLVLVLRQMFILALLLAAPLAILAWIFPGNDKLWKLWWGSFTKLLIMFPLITGLIAMGRVFAYLFGNTPAGGAQGGLLNPLLKITAYVVPYLLIPLTFKFAGGAFATITGAMNDRGKGVFDRLKKRRQHGWQKIGQNAKDGHLLRDNERIPFRKGINTAGEGAFLLGKAGLDPRKMKAKMGVALDDARAVQKKKAAEDPENALFWNYDNLARVGAVSKNETDDRKELRRQDDERMNIARAAAETKTRSAGKSAAEIAAAGDTAAAQASRYRNPNELNKDVARVGAMRKKMGAEAFSQLSAQKMVAGGTANTSAAEALKIVAQNAGGDGAVLMDAVAKFRSDAMSAGQVAWGGASQGTTFEIAKMLAGGMKIEDANKLIHAGVLDSQGASVLLHPSMKKASIIELIPEINARMDAAIATGDTDKIDQNMALINNLHTALASSAPKLADEFGAKVLQRQIPTGSLPPGARDALGSSITTTREVSPRREVQVPVKLPNGVLTGEMETIIIPAVTEEVSSQTTVTAKQLLNSRKGSEVYNSFTKDYGAAEQAARTGAAGPAPGAPAAPGPPTGI